MKRLWPITILLCLLLAAGCIILVRCPRTVPDDQCSEVYRRYKDSDNLSVAFVKDYRIGDSITVDVTTITATDSASWEQLLREMNMPDFFIRQYYEKTRQGHPGLGFYNCPHNQPEKSCEIDAKDIDLVFIFFNEMTFYIFDVQNKEQAHLIKHYKMKETFN